MTCLGLDNNLRGSGDAFFQACLALDGLKIVSRCFTRAAGAGAVRARPEQRTACTCETCFTPLHLFSLIKGLKKSTCLALEPPGKLQSGLIFSRYGRFCAFFYSIYSSGCHDRRLDAMWMPAILCIIDETPHVVLQARKGESLNRASIEAAPRCSPSLYQRKQLCQA